MYSTLDLLLVILFILLFYYYIKNEYIYILCYLFISIYMILLCNINIDVNYTYFHLYSGIIDNYIIFDAIFKYKLLITLIRFISIFIIIYSIYYMDIYLYR